MGPRASPSNRAQPAPPNACRCLGNGLACRSRMTDAGANLGRQRALVEVEIRPLTAYDVLRGGGPMIAASQGWEMKTARSS
jgi:hypothetical protein